DEYQLYWGFSFGWGSLDGNLATGPARISLVIDKPGEAWRQVDAILLTDDLTYTPVGREKPPFGYLSTINLVPKNGAAWRGKWRAGGVSPLMTPPAQRKRLAGRDFSMWTGVSADPKWWAKQNLNALTLYDVFFEHSPPADIKDKFHKQFAGRKDVPIMSWLELRPGFYLGDTPDLSPG